MKGRRKKGYTVSNEMLIKSQNLDGETPGVGWKPHMVLWVSLKHQRLTWQGLAKQSAQLVPTLCCHGAHCYRVGMAMGTLF